MRSARTVCGSAAPTCGGSQQRSLALHLSLLTPGRAAAPHLQGGLGAVEGLAAAVRSGGAPAGAAEAAPADAAALAQAVVAAEVPVKLLGAMQQVGGHGRVRPAGLAGSPSFASASSVAAFHLRARRRSPHMCLPWPRPPPGPPLRRWWS